MVDSAEPWYYMTSWEDKMLFLLRILCILSSITHLRLWALGKIGTSLLARQDTYEAEGIYFFNHNKNSNMAVKHLTVHFLFLEMWG